MFASVQLEWYDGWIDERGTMEEQVSEASAQTATEKAYKAAGVDPSIQASLVPDDDALTLYIEASKLIDFHEQQVKELKKLTGAIEPAMIEYFKAKGTQKITRNGRTVYLAREIWPKILDSDLTEGITDEGVLATAKETARSRLIEALAGDEETKHLVSATYSHMTLRSFILNDCQEGDDGLPIIPEHLRGKLGVAEQFRAKVLRTT